MIEAKKVMLEVHDEILELWESLIMRRVLLIPQQGVQELDQRRNVFRIGCKEKDKCYKLIIDNGCIDNLVSTKMVEILGLKKLSHPTLYTGLLTRYLRVELSVNILK